MANLNELYTEKDRYIRFKTNVGNLINSLDGVIKKFDTPINNISVNFIIDNVPILSNKLNNIKLHLQSRRSNLSGPVLNRIEERINYYNNAIYQEEERIRLEEEQRQRELRESMLDNQ